jgi:hypothetical protein
MGVYKVVKIWIAIELIPLPTKERGIRFKKKYLTTKNNKLY